MSTDVAKKEVSQSERFMLAVGKQFQAAVGQDIETTSYQKKLIQNYFVKLDMVLKDSEKKRLSKKDPDPLEYSWANVNMAQLSLDVVSFSLVGLDPLQPNHINLIPYKNTSTEKYDITFMMGYDGIELKAKKYGIDVPDDVIIELVYENDEFDLIKKDINNKVESYHFKRPNPFDRGDVIGGFYAFIYFDKPEKNIVKVYSKEDIEKRKPKYASAEFWGGEKTAWKNGKKDGVEKVEGWYEEMAYKTIKRAAYNSITIDSEKIDEHYMKTLAAERAIDQDPAERQVNMEIASKANKKMIKFEDAEVVEEEAPKSAIEAAKTESFDTSDLPKEKEKVPAQPKPDTGSKEAEKAKPMF